MIRFAPHHCHLPITQRVCSVSNQQTATITGRHWEVTGSVSIKWQEGTAIAISAQWEGDSLAERLQWWWLALAPLSQERTTQKTMRCEKWQVSKCQSAIHDSLQKAMKLLECCVWCCQPDMSGQFVDGAHWWIHHQHHHQYIRYVMSAFCWQLRFTSKHCKLFLLLYWSHGTPCV